KAELGGVARLRPRGENLSGSPECPGRCGKAFAQLDYPAKLSRRPRLGMPVRRQDRQCADVPSRRK
ncbi:MAG: hypothetical protein ACRDRT_16170, partial [Pseudonocardiaceae bacterium]